MRIKRTSAKWACILIVLALSLALISSCGKKPAEGVLYQCPMHPTYISDRPGDCPICGMRLVPIETKTAAPVPQLYTCPMHPEVTSDKPGRCPKCGMDLVPVEQKEQKSAATPSREGHEAEMPGMPGMPGMEAASQTPQPAASEHGAAASSPAVEGLAPVQLGERALTLAGVQTEAAVKEVMQREIRTVGIVLPDERLIRHIHTKNSGWIEKLYINFTGQLVKKGEPVLGIYSPELLASQEEFLKARETAAKFANSSLPEVRRGGQDLVDAARKRLRLFDVPEKFIEELEKTGLPKRTVTLPAPVSGYVTAKGTFEGQQVEPGTVLFTITDLSRVWIEADFYEYESQAVHTGQEANVSFPYGEAKLLKGKVSYVYPYLNPDSRTLKVRFEFANPELMLKPSMYVDVLLAINASESIVVPDSAVIDSGLRQIVFVEKAKGLFEPREVTVGLRSGGKAQVLAGLSEGERVVVGANFLIDSESRLKAAVGAMEGHRHGN